MKHVKASLTSCAAWCAKQLQFSKMFMERILYNKSAGSTQSPTCEKLCRRYELGPEQLQNHNHAWHARPRGDACYVRYPTKAKERTEQKLFCQAMAPCASKCFKRHVHARTSRLSLSLSWYTSRLKQAVASVSQASLATHVDFQFRAASSL